MSESPAKRLASGHSIRFEFDDGTVDAKVVCHEPEDSDCRLTSAGPECDCEFWGRIERRKDGTIWHALTNGYRDLTLDRDAEQWHQVKPMSECNIALWTNESGCVMEYAARGTRLVLADVPITTTWDGDDYEWSPSNSSGWEPDQ